MLTIACVCFVFMMTSVWLKTNAFYEYFGWTPIGRRYKTFVMSSKAPVTFVDYLCMAYAGFWVRLLTCTVCLTVWLSILIGLLTQWYLIPVYFTGNLVLFTYVYGKIN